MFLNLQYQQRTGHAGLRGSWRGDAETRCSGGELRERMDDPGPAIYSTRHPMQDQSGRKTAARIYSRCRSAIQQPRQCIQFIGSSSGSKFVLPGTTQ
eukprot:scaffold337577_cov21-Prasinocladus_malaysianus.AAC.1